MKKYNFTVVIEKDTDTNMYVAEVPGLAGCHTQAKTIDELMARMKEVIALCLEEEGDKLSQLPKFVGLQQIEVSA